MADLARPTDDVEDVLIVGGQADRAVELFAKCDPVGELGNRVGVENEEEGMPLVACHGPLRPWSDLWHDLRHLD